MKIYIFIVLFFGINVNIFATEAPTKTYKDANYVDTSKFSEVDVVLPPDTLLEGKLTLPNVLVGRKVPCVILVHGSGPSDYDETILGNRPFRDIAFGLASNGIAVLRYNKRTFVDKNLDIAKVTVYEESINDAVNAVEFVLSKYGDMISDVYVLGHSLGGYLLPRISVLSGKTKGFISLAGSVRPMEVLIKEQMQYIFDNFGNTHSYEAKAKLEAEFARCDKVIAGNFTIDTPKDSLPLGVDANYWLNLVNYRPVELFANEHRPILFVQGGRDYQVTTTDFNLWKDGLKNMPNCKFVLIDDLNHLFQSGEGISGPGEYTNIKNVDERVINEIVRWCKENGR